MTEEKLAYPVCSGWFFEFIGTALEWLEGDLLCIANDGSFYKPEEFVFEPMCNYHQEGVYLSRDYWVAMAEAFGYSPEEGVVTYDPDAVEPKLVARFLNTRCSWEGSYTDTKTMELICETKGIVIG